MNFLRKSTDGFSIGNILLDFSGGIANYGQMVVQSIDQGLSSPHLCCWYFLSFDYIFLHSLILNPIFPDSWVNFYGNIGKVLLSLVWEALLRNILLLSYVNNCFLFFFSVYFACCCDSSTDYWFWFYFLIIILILEFTTLFFGRENELFYLRVMAYYSNWVVEALLRIQFCILHRSRMEFVPGKLCLFIWLARHCCLMLLWHCFLCNTQLQVSVFFDIIFIIQHYVLYRGKKSSKLEITTEQEDQIREHLVRHSDQSSPENV